MIWLMSEQAPHGVDTSTPNVARMYDFLLGGKDNFAADRAAAQHLLAAIPDIGAIAADNRAFLRRAVRFLAAEAGIRQFLDLGGGLPTRANVHEVAQQVTDDARVVYIDYDPVVVRHGQALLADGKHVAMVQADLTRPAEVLAHDDVLRVLDLGEPVALICTATLHFTPDEADPHQIIATYRDKVAPGSYLVLTHAPAREAGDEPAYDAENATSVYSQASAQLHLRSMAELRRFFDGFDLVDPGVVWMADWRPDTGSRPAGRPRSLRAGVARKP
jgi:O-methyltransferase involved in polyketide biosynthesis